MSKHTVGPWKYDGLNYIFADGNMMVAEIRGQGWGAPMDENARLIAAAPELLECLDAVDKNWSVLNDEHFGGVADKLKVLIKQALAKAQGEP